MSLQNQPFEESYSRLFGADVGVSEEADPFFERFYEKFLADDEVAKLFANTDMVKQVQMLKRSLFQLVAFYVTGEPSAELDRIAKVHDVLNLDGTLYDKWLDALLDTVMELDDEADETTRLAWGWALSPGITYMRLALR